MISSASSAPTPAEGSVDKNRDGMDVALVQHPQHDVDGHDRGQNQQRFARQRIAKRRRRPLKAGMNAGRHLDLLLGSVDRFGRVAQ